MAHKELITKYTKQITESSQRIFELEVAVADARAELEAAKAGGGSQYPHDASKTTELRNELVGKQQEIDKLVAELQALKEDNVQVAPPGTVPNLPDGARVKRLENKLAARKKEIEELKKSAATGTAPAHAREIKDLQASLAAKDERIATLLAEAPRRLHITATGPQLRQAKIEAETLNAALQTSEDKVEGLQKELKASKVRAQSLGQDKGRITGQLNRLLKSKAQAEEKEKEVAALRDEVVKLQNRVDREKKRRSEAESMLGPGGKRCKKCNPLVIELDASDGEEEDRESTAEAKAKAKAKLVEDAVIPPPRPG